MSVVSFWNRLSRFDQKTDYFQFNIQFFKILGFSVWHESAAYSFYRIVSAISVALLWVFIGWDVVNNLGNFAEISDNISTSTVHLMGLIRYLSFVCLEKHFGNNFCLTNKFTDSQ